jgi:hypothetical protein
MERITSFYASDRRYASLRVIGRLFFVIGMVGVGLPLLALVFGLYDLIGQATGAVPRRVAPGVGAPGAPVPLFHWGGAFSLLVSWVFLLSGLQLVALGTLFRLLIHLEENTRATAQSLDRIQSQLASSREGAEPSFRS